MGMRPLKAGPRTGGARPSAPERWSSRMAEERVEVQRGSREKYPRGSPHGLPPPYRSKGADWSPRQPHQHNEGKAKRREAEGHQRNWQSESEGRDVSPWKQTSPVRGRSRKPSPRQEMGKEERASEEQSETGQENPQKEKSVSPHRRGKDVDGAKSEGDTNNKEEEVEGGYETEEESWYPQNMEELVTVDEVGEEDDNIVEPDLPELQEKPTVQDLTVEPPQTGDNSNGREEGVRNDSAPESASVKPPQEEHADEHSNACPTPTSSVSKEACSDRGESPGPELKAVCEEPCPCTDMALAQPLPECLPNHRGECNPTSYVTNKPAPITKATAKDVQHQDEHTGNIPMTETDSPSHQSPSSTDVDSPLWEYDNVVSEHSIPLGVEFVVPRSGYFCKLCGLFYASEETAKIAHCRSTVHYKNLQKYLSQLGADSLENLHMCPATPERSSLIPQTKERKSPAGVGLN
ncbi:hypothetical protein AAFF_G00364530 [Aldrovandia affinis]|uniref:Matrin-type domain-containing protein n=1 Tax=Aldrovandia affinis TaxID=143900 RepID=A0AAD7SHQ7_9TELE|nr:hypothetical protein AAFF_G00364530 [Aldrovandia affinis]